MSKTCLQCSHQLHDDSKFCPNCGATVPVAPPSWSQPSNDIVGQNPSTAPQWAPTPAPFSGGPPVAGPPAGQPPYVGAEYGPTNPPVAEPANGRSVGRLIGIGLAIIGVGAIGLLALRFVTGGDKVAGGASSPEAVIEELAAAANAKDPLAMVALMAPDELDGIDAVIAEADRLLGIRSAKNIDDEDLSIEVEADGIDVQMEGDNAAVVEFELSGDVEVGESSIGLLETFGIEGGRFDGLDLENVLPNGSANDEIVVVKIDGKWFASPILTVGHYIAEYNDLPSGEYDLVGETRDEGESTPEDAVEAFVDVINDPDADALAAILGGGEGRFATVFSDAIDELLSDVETSGYDVSMSTEDLGNGRVELVDVELQFEDDFSSSTIEYDDGCFVERFDGDDSPNRLCVLEELDAEDTDVDTTLWLDTANEDGSSRIRIAPTVMDVVGRLLALNQNRQELLSRLGLEWLDQARPIEPGNDVEIEFDGQLYAVHEFDVTAGEHYNVTTDVGEPDIYLTSTGGVSAEQYESWIYAETDGTVLVVTHSDTECDEYEFCLPSGEGTTTLRIRQAESQSIDFPTIVEGELGPGDVRVFELQVAQPETVFISVYGDSVDWSVADSFLINVDFDTYDFESGTYRMMVANTSGTDSTSYEIVPEAVESFS